MISSPVSGCRDLGGTYAAATLQTVPILFPELAQLSALIAFGMMSMPGFDVLAFGAWAAGLVLVALVVFGLVAYVINRTAFRMGGVSLARPFQLGARLIRLPRAQAFRP